MSATANFLPDPTDPATKLYQGQKLFLTVNISSTTPIRNGTFVYLYKLGEGFAYDTSAILPVYSNPRPIDINPNNNKIGSVEFILDVLPNPPTTSANNLTFVVGSDSAELGLSKTPASYNILAPRFSPIFTGPTPPEVPIPPLSEPNPLTPAATQYTMVMSATMTPYCVIDWYATNRVSELISNFFTTQVYTYLNATDTVPIQDNYDYYWPNGPLSYDFEENQFIRTVTDGDGVARLYLVADNQNPQGGNVEGQIEAWTWYDNNLVVGPFAVR